MFDGLKYQWQKRGLQFNDNHWKIDTEYVYAKHRVNIDTFQIVNARWFFGQFICNRKGNSTSNHRDDKVRTKISLLCQRPELSLLLVLLDKQLMKICRRRRLFIVIYCWFETIHLTMRKQYWFDCVQCHGSTFWTANFLFLFSRDASSFPICLVKWLGL